MIKEIVYDLGQWNIIGDRDTRSIQILHVTEFTAFVLTQFHNRTYIIVRHYDACLNVRLLHLIDLTHFRIM
ncbi:hypothetical protein D3C85_1258540 [compost metagenome]